ncbi:MAG: alpha/beta hydrolase [Myxococcales bacterium]|nr:alpha/beta hydrolase [Myxococcales bacterium]
MPLLERAGARIYYEEVGEGDAILTNHGLSENGTYWSLPGVTDALARDYRVVSMDMRAHGRSEITDGARAGLDADTMAEDIGALADALGIERFHLLTHATGGMVALNYARKHHARLLSLMLTDTGSATAIAPDERTAARLREAFANHFQGKTWSELLPSFRSSPEPFMTRLSAAPRPTQAWAFVDAIMQRGNPDELAAFCRSFYTDPDPHVDELRHISCRTLVLLGEHDTLFIEPSELLAKEIPNAKHVVMESLGHMTALEAPDRLIAELHAFLEDR